MIFRSNVKVHSSPRQYYRITMVSKCTQNNLSVLSQLCVKNYSKYQCRFDWYAISCQLLCSLLDQRLLKNVDCNVVCISLCFTLTHTFPFVFSPEMSAMMQKAQAAAIAAAAAAATASQQQTSPKAGSHGSSDKFSQLCVYCNQVNSTHIKHFSC